MKFKCNNSEWEIKEVDEAIMNNEEKNDYTLGLTFYKKHEIWLLNTNANMLRTLKHELMHVWLWEYGHSQNDSENFTYENVCEIVACSNDFINEVVQKYLGIEPLYLCDKEKNTECKKRSCDVCMMTNNIKYAKRKEKTLGE